MMLAEKSIELINISKKNNVVYKNGGVDNLSILCYNISMINEIESFYFILSFVMKDNT